MGTDTERSHEESEEQAGRIETNQVEESKQENSVGMKGNTMHVMEIGGEIAPFHRRQLQFVK